MKLKSFADIIGLWPSYMEFETDLDLNRGLAAVWVHRNSIPPDMFRAVAAAAEQRGYQGVSVDRMLALHEQRVNAA